MSNPLAAILNRVLGAGLEPRRLAEQAAKELLRQKAEARLLKAAAGITAKVTKSKKDKRGQIREALFLLWKELVKSGDIADAFRDFYDDPILAALLPQEFDSPAALVDAVIREQVRIVL